MLKDVMAGKEIKASERKWDPDVNENNIEAVEKTYGISVERSKNETSIPMSKKRKDDK